MEDPTPPLDTPEVIGVSKPGGPKSNREPLGFGNPKTMGMPMSRHPSSGPQAWRFLRLDLGKSPRVRASASCVAIVKRAERGDRDRTGYKNSG